MPATVDECERIQARWNAALAIAGGGEVWDDDGLQWSWQAHDRQLMLSFPRAVGAPAAQRGLDAARRRDARIVGAWLSTDTDPAGLEEAGFERGWEPWWMAAPLHAIPEPTDPRVAVTAEVPEYGPEGQRQLSLARAKHPQAWHAAARVDGRLAGRAWCLVVDDTTGIYDMEVWPQFQRRGLGRALLRAVCGAARAVGATRATLNATPAGERLYSAEGFVHVGTGITYWHRCIVGPGVAHMDAKETRCRS